MFTLTKQFSFSAAHHLPHLPEDHPCHRVHGHNYKVELVFRDGGLDERGFAFVDYRELDPFKKALDEKLDHQDLNAVLDFQTTAERLARYLYKLACTVLPHPVAVRLKAVRVSETDKTWAEYST